MYTSFPIKSDVTISSQGRGMTLELINSLSSVPIKCQNFLDKLGWTMSSSHPDSGETLFQKTPPSGCTDDERSNWNHDLQYSYWHWYEAMAYEFGKFMGIDEDTGGASNADQAGGVSTGRVPGS